MKNQRDPGIGAHMAEMAKWRRGEIVVRKQTKEELIERLIQAAIEKKALRTEDHGRDVRNFRRWLRTRTKGEIQNFLGMTP